MVLREYHCAKCGVTFERLIRTERDERKVTCPTCGEPRVRRRLSRFSTSSPSSSKERAKGSCACGGSCACNR